MRAALTFLMGPDAAEALYSDMKPPCGTTDTFRMDALHCIEFCVGGKVRTRAL